MYGVTGKPCGYQHLAPTAATGLTLPTTFPGGTAAAFDGVKLILISISTASVNIRDDGTAPTAAANGGFPLPAGTVLPYAGNFANLQFISATGLVDILYYG